MAAGHPCDTAESLSRLPAQIINYHTIALRFACVCVCVCVPPTNVCYCCRTNLYVCQKITAKGPDPIWTETTPEEIRAYLSILIMMGIKHQPRLWCYWSTDPRFTNPRISSVMPKTRFFKLNQYFHPQDTSQTPGHDSLEYDPSTRSGHLLS